MKQLVDQHPALCSLPDHLRQRLAVEIGSWNDLPSNRRQRRRWQRDGLTVHLFAGPSAGFTLEKAVQRCGGGSVERRRS